MVNPKVTENDEQEGADRRAIPRYELEHRAILHLQNEKYPVTIKDITVYGMGLSIQDSGIDGDIAKKQRVSVEWQNDMLIDADVVWSFKERVGLLLSPPLKEDHPLLEKAALEQNKV